MELAEFTATSGFALAGLAALATGFAVGLAFALALGFGFVVLAAGLGAALSFSAINFLADVIFASVMMGSLKTEQSNKHTRRRHNKSKDHSATHAIDCYV